MPELSTTDTRQAVESHPAVSRWTPWGRLLRTWWPVLVLLVIVVVGAWIYRWVDEDAFINFRVIDNLLAGHGPVFNVGERVEVYSDPLWLYLLALLHLVFPFVSLEWTSVVLGLVCTGLGVAVGARAVQRLAVSRGAGVVLPLGLLIVCVVAGVWEFATSGLEISMVFLWIGASFSLLVRAENRHRGSVVPAVVVGLGPLVRPELALMSVVFIVGLGLVVAAPQWSGPGGLIRRYVVPLAAAVFLPVVSELFRMAYFALLVPNTGLAKVAGSSWWSQGFTYVWNFAAPYTLWLPLLLAAPFVALPLHQWWVRHDRTGVLLLGAPLVAGVLDLLYVAHLGGDYMHARLLLPAFFAICLPVFATPRQLKSLLVVPLVGIVLWSVVCAGWLRYVPPREGLGSNPIFISNERNSWISATGNAHPVTAADYDHALSGRAGVLFRRIAATSQPSRQGLLVVTNPFAPIHGNSIRPALSSLPFTLAVNVPAIGVIGYVSGPAVYLFDQFSLANPIGSHTIVRVHGRPGHEKPIGPAWMVGRFGVPGEHLLGGMPTASSVIAARTALACEPLHGYLEAITRPMSISRAWSNAVGSFTYTSMSFSAEPRLAARQLCRR